MEEVDGQCRHCGKHCHSGDRVQTVQELAGVDPTQLRVPLHHCHEYLRSPRVNSMLTMSLLVKDFKHCGSSRWIAIMTVNVKKPR